MEGAGECERGGGEGVDGGGVSGPGPSAKTSDDAPAEVSPAGEKI